MRLGGVGPNPLWLMSWLMSLQEKDIWAHKEVPGIRLHRKHHVRSQQEGLQAKERDRKRSCADTVTLPFCVGYCIESSDLWT